MNRLTVRSFKRTGGLDAAPHPSGGPFEGRNILALVPQPARGQNLPAPGNRAGSNGTAAVSNRSGQDAVARRRRLHEGETGGDQTVTTPVALGEPLRPPVEILRQGRSTHRVPPGRHAGVTNPDHGRAPVLVAPQGGAVKVHQIHTVLGSQTAQGPRRLVQRAGTVRQPIERPPRLDQREPPNLFGGSSLGGTGRRARHG